MATKCLASNECLTADAGKQVTERRQGKEDSGGDETGRMEDAAQELHKSQGTVGSRSEVVGRDSANGRVEFARGRADAEKQWNLNEEDDERRHNSHGAKDDDGNPECEDVGDAYRETYDHGQDAQPLSVDTEVSCLEFLPERHVDGYDSLSLGSVGRRDAVRHSEGLDKSEIGKQVEQGRRTRADDACRV